jgi:hypothetical protein
MRPASRPGGQGARDSETLPMAAVHSNRKGPGAEAPDHHPDTRCCGSRGQHWQTGGRHRAVQVPTCRVVLQPGPGSRRSRLLGLAVIPSGRLRGLRGLRIEPSDRWSQWERQDEGWSAQQAASTGPMPPPPPQVERGPMSPRPGLNCRCWLLARPPQLLLRVWQPAPARPGNRLTVPFSSLAAISSCGRHVAGL